MILEEGPFSSWDSESSEVDISVEFSTTLGVRGVLGDAGFYITILELLWAREEESLWGFPH